VGSDGRPLADVHIELRDEQNGQAIASAYTNGAGAFAIDNVPVSSYQLVATQGLAQATQRLAGGDAGMNLRIQLNNVDASTASAGGSASVSVAEYRVPQKARDALRKAQSALAKGRHDEVARELSKALQIDPDYAAALTLSGVLELDKGNTQAAIADFDHAMHSDPNYAMAYTAMAAAQNQMSKFDDALRSADRAVTLAPQSWQSYFESAKAYAGKADYQHALQQLSKTQSLLPSDYAPIHLLRGHVMIALKDYNAASNELQAFLTEAPGDPNAPAAKETLEKLRAFTTAQAKTPAIAPH
jgi:tetratricopeptide (TPR) repeat protein